MWQVLGNVLVTLLMIYMEVPKLIKKESKRELFTYSILLFFAFIVGVMISIGLPVPNPIIWLDEIFHPISQWFKALVSS